MGYMQETTKKEMAEFLFNQFKVVNIDQPTKNQGRIYALQMPLMEGGTLCISIQRTQYNGFKMVDSFVKE